MPNTLNNPPPSNPSGRWLISDVLWAKIEPLLPSPPKRKRYKGGRPRVQDRSAMNGILFVLRTGCQWNALNATGICSSSTAHLRFQEWVGAGVFQKLWAVGLTNYDELKGITVAVAGPGWRDDKGAARRGKKPGPTPRTEPKGVLSAVCCVRAEGGPVGLAVDGTNRHDMKLVEATLESVPVKRPGVRSYWRQNLCLDKGYDFDEVRDLAEEFGDTAHIRPRGEEADAIRHNARFKARRWVVERTHSWLNRFRYILVRWAKKARNYVGLRHFVCAIITFRHVEVLG